MLASGGVGEVSAQWHPTKNGDLKPEDFTTGSSKKVWWQCPLAEDHEWQTTVDHQIGAHRNIDDVNLIACCVVRPVSLFQVDVERR